MNDAGMDRARSTDGTMPLMGHLVELRSRLIKCILAVVAGAVACWVLYPQILDLMVQPYCDIVPEQAVAEEAARQNLFGGCELLVLDPLEPFSVRLTVAGYGGLTLAIPIILWQVWRFVQPGLYPRERRHAAAFTVVGALLFALGAGLAYWSIPRALKFLATIGGEDLVTGFSPAKYLSFVIKMMAAFGIGFEFPILLVFLQFAGIIHYRQLIRWRRFAIVGIVALVAVITPSGDPFTLMVLSVPMYLFYEAAIVVGWLRDRRNRRETTGEADTNALEASQAVSPSED
ncbi:MAG: twin-arginine translocase subunit TatC [Acidimicrobiia bacterium]|nr:twin-arginine translocase subunit TatC [Acidimicrobiia bacterium]MYG72853.1 twin-arginine translocase subunit TatC [Acidimicrobiia bacterium]MYH96272.1 twin-arginine translocase subunit TatC [Acidimicrobiia bacterium]MYL10119.1 twin-arginine translocase subunit TatC [Acidimicrobiia bacterium]